MCGSGLFFLLDLAQQRVVGCSSGVVAGVAGARLFGLDAALGVGGGGGSGGDGGAASVGTAAKGRRLYNRL